MFLIHCAYFNFLTLLLAVGKVKSGESKKWVFMDGHLDEPQELEMVAGAFREMGNYMHQMLSFSCKFKTLWSAMEEKPFK